MSLPAQSCNKCYTNDHSMLNIKQCRHGRLLSTRHVTRPTAELLLGFDNCPKQRNAFHIGLARRLDRCPRVSLRNSPQCTAAKQIEIAHRMRSRHAEDAAIDGARDRARDYAEMPNATIQSGAKTALAETPSWEPREPFMTPLRRRTLAALRLEQSFQV